MYAASDILIGTSSPGRIAGSSYILGKMGRPCPLPVFWACHDVHEGPMAVQIDSVASHQILDSSLVPGDMRWCKKSLFSLSVLTKENLVYSLVYLTKVWPLALSSQGGATRETYV